MRQLGAVKLGKRKFNATQELFGDGSKIPKRVVDRVMQATEMPLVFIDVECTGLDIISDRVIEVAACKVMPGESERKIHTRRINPQWDISPGARRVHGISNADVKDCPTFSQVAPRLANYMRGCALVAHNASFDAGFLNKEFSLCRMGRPFKGVIDTLDIARSIWPGGRHSLGALAKRLAVRDVGKAHSAGGDVLTLLGVWDRIVREVKIYQKKGQADEEGGDRR